MNFMLFIFRNLSHLANIYIRKMPKSKKYLTLHNKHLPNIKLGLI